MSLRKKIENHFRNRSGQGSLVGVIVATVMFSMIVAAATEWYLSMRKNIGNTEDKLEAQTIAMSEWERLSHMSLDELEASREALKNPYAAGQFTVSVNLGQKGTFNNGTCGAITGGYANCFKDTTITVSRDGSRLFTTRTLPLMAGDYTRRELDNLLASIKNDYTNKYNPLANRLNGNEFIKNKTPSYDMNFRYEKKAGDDKATIHAYIGNTEVPLGSQGGGTKLAFGKRIKVNLNSNWIAPSDGFLVYTGVNTCANPWGSTTRKMYINGLEIADLSEGEHGESNVNISIPVAKGNTVKMIDEFETSSVWYSYTYFYPLE